MSKRKTDLKTKAKQKNLLFRDKQGKEIGRFETVAEAALALGFTEYAVKGWINKKISPANRMSLELINE